MPFRWLHWGLGLLSKQEWVLCFSISGWFAHVGAGSCSPSSATAEPSSPELQHLCSSAIDCFLTTRFPEVWERFELYPKFLCYNAWKMHLKEAYTQNAALQKWFFHHIPINLRMLLRTFSSVGMKPGNISSYSEFFISAHGNWSNPRYQTEPKPDWPFVFQKHPPPRCYVSAFGVLFLNMK